MKVLSVVLLLVGVLVCYSSGADVCVPDSNELLKGIKATELARDKLVGKTWYELRSLNSDYSNGGCVSANYSEIDTNNKKDLNVVYTFWNNKNAQTAEYKLELIPQTVTANTFKDSFNIMNGTVNMYDYRFLLMEDESYVVVYGCKMEGAGTTATRKQKLSILSTKTTLEERKQGGIELVLQKLNVIKNWDNETWTIVEQDAKVCSSASVFALSTVLSVIVTMLLVLRN